jgi:hypothetical protein
MNRNIATIANSADGVVVASSSPTMTAHGNRKIASTSKITNRNAKT